MSQLVLFVDDEEHLRVAAEQTLQLADFQPICLESGDEALNHIDRSFPGVLITDLRMSGMDGLTLMSRVLERDPDFPVMLVTGHGDIELAVQSMRAGAYDFLEKPYEPQRLVDTTRRALEKRRLTLENRSLRSQATGVDAVAARLSGNSPIMVNLRKTLRSVALANTDVLILGATGTGKEMAARSMHEIGPRAEKPFVSINCAALPAELIESELFGHEAGAFPGALRARYGKFEHAQGGTVFLDEIDSLSSPVQAKLLHAIQNRQITRLGSNELIDLDVRFIAASKRDLEADATAHVFRSDLYYSLSVVSLRMPSLAERSEDVPLLFLKLVHDAAYRAHKAAPDVPEAILSAIAARTWPGNVRELRNAAERYVLGLGISPTPAHSNGVDASATEALEANASLAHKMSAHEKAIISASLVANDGNLKSTYEALKISRKTLYEKMLRHNLSREYFSDEDKV